MAVHPFRGTSMLYGRMGELYVVLHGSVAPANVEWNAWLEDVPRELPRIRGLLVYTEGAGPNATQRKRTADMWARQTHVPPIALVTTSPMVRVMMTALNYFLSRPIRAYPPEELSRALTEHLNIAAVHHEELRQTIGLGLRSLRAMESAADHHGPA